MGSHSTEAKRRKRKAQKKKKRALKRLKYQVDSSQSTADHESSTLDELGTLSESADHSPLKESHELCACHSEEDLFTLLDRVAESKERFWEEIEPEIRQLESYRDAHPSLVLDQDRYIEVFVGGDSQDHRGLLRVSTEEYFARMHRREAKAMALCRTLRNRIESLEKDIEAGRQKMVTVHKEKNQAVSAMRDFWRNKIFEQQSYGGRMVLAALRRGHF